VKLQNEIAAASLLGSRAGPHRCHQQAGKSRDEPPIRLAGCAVAAVNRSYHQQEATPVTESPVRFVLTLQPLSGIDAVKALRWVLKKAGRLGLKCVELHEEKPNSRTERDNAPDVSPAKSRGPKEAPSP
jgi:hypothetical protein